MPNAGGYSHKYRQGWYMGVLMYLYCQVLRRGTEIDDQLLSVAISPWPPHYRKVEVM